MEERRGGVVQNSIWEELQGNPIMEPSDPLEIKRGFFKRLFGTFYDRMGSLLLLNVAVTAQLGIGALVGVFLAITVRASGATEIGLLATTAALAGAPAYAGLCAYVRAICDDDAMPSLADYTRGMRKYMVKSWLLLLMQAASGALLALNLRFYSGYHGTLGLAVVFLLLVLTLVWAMAGLYVWPLLVRDVGWGPLLRNALFIALAAPFSTIAILLSLGVFSALLIAIRIGWVLVLFAAWALTANVALQRLVRIFRERQVVTESAASESADEVDEL